MGLRVNINDYNKYIAYGIGQHYTLLKDEIKKLINFDYICDQKLDKSDIEYDNIPIIDKLEISKLNRPLVIVFAGGIVRQSIEDTLVKLELPFVNANDLLKNNVWLSGEGLRKAYPSGKYTDEKGNEIIFDDTIPDKIVINLCGKNNKIVIGNMVLVERMTIEVGSNACFKIGNNTKVSSCVCFVSEAEMIIGDDCMISWDVLLRTHDGHHIFDAITGDRINYEKDVVIGNHVWLCKGVTMLSGSRVGTGSVVGAQSVVTHEFGEHKIIAGVPAKVIRDNVCWSYDMINLFSHNNISECIDKAAQKYRKS